MDKRKGNTQTFQGLPIPRDPKCHLPVKGRASGSQATVECLAQVQLTMDPVVPWAHFVAISLVPGEVTGNRHTWQLAELPHWLPSHTQYQLANSTDKSHNREG